MKKTVLVMTLLAAAVVQASALETPLHLPYAPDIEKIVERGELRVAIYGGALPPFIVKTSDGKVGGYDVNVAQAIATQLHVKLRLDASATTFDDVVGLVANDHDDIAISNLTATPDRALSVNFSVPYYNMPQALLFKKKGLSKLWRRDQVVVSNQALSLAVNADSSYVYYAKLAFPKAHIDTYPDLATGIKQLKAGAYDALFTDGLSASQAVKDTALLTFPLGQSHVDPLTIAVNNHSPQVLSWLNVYLSSAAAKTLTL